MDTKAEATQPQFRSGVSGSKPGELCFGFDEILGHLSAPPETDGSSFTALLELSPPQAVELLIKEDIPAKPKPPPIFPSNITLIDRASKFSVFASDSNSPEGTTNLSTSKKLDLVKQELLESASHPNSSSPAVSTQSLKSSKRKEENKVKESNKKSKRMVAASEESGGKLPYVHVRARRGQATDSHSLAERARREKINDRMKQLQELVPGCSKISGTAMVLDQIINHVRALQHQVEFLSMSLAAVNPSINLNLDAVLAAESGSSIDNSPLVMLAPSMWPEGQIDGSRQHHYQHQPSWGREEDNSNFNSSDSLLNYYPSANTAFLRSSLLKKEL